MMTDMTYVHRYTLVLTCWPSAAGHLDNTSHLTPDIVQSGDMRVTGYKVILLVCYTIIIACNLLTLVQLYQGDEASSEDTWSTFVYHASKSSLETLMYNKSHMTNITNSDLYHDNNISEIRSEVIDPEGVKNFLYYPALAATRNSWTLYDIRRGSRSKKKQPIE